VSDDTVEDDADGDVVRGVDEREDAPAQPE
jgi:hypothetical protein